MLCWARGLNSKGSNASIGDNNDSIYWKLRQLSSNFGLLLCLNQHAKMGITMLAGVIDPDYQGDIRLLFHNGDKEEFV